LVGGGRERSSELTGGGGGGAADRGGSARMAWGRKRTRWPFIHTGSG
jgi:hypothetical protein